MATDFFERQDEARRSTKRLIVLFTLAVVGIVGATMVVAWIGMNEGQLWPRHEVSLWSPQGGPSDDVAVPLMAGGASLLLIGLGSLYKTAQLSGGGHVVAEHLGGRRVFPDTKDPVERRVLNVVEEMALASGVPVPPVFLMSEEPGINAFAAGYSPRDAVVSVTRGTAEQLSRDELQGVVAHEFSHILNGDMRLNIRLIGVLNGILLLGLIGRIFLRIAANSRPRGNSKNAGGFIAGMALVGLSLFILGYLGTFIGNLIKAAVSRQREFLADASAVQFTRNPGGLAGALKRIGALVTGSRLRATNASEASHMFFAEGVWEGFTALTASHPPINERIRRLDPQWDGAFPVEKLTTAQFYGPKEAAGLVGTEAEAAAANEFVPVTIVAHASNQVGDPQEPHRKYAAALVESLPEVVRDSSREPYGSRAVLFGLLLDRDPDIRGKQLTQLRASTTDDVYQLTEKLIPYIDILDVRARLPLVDLAMPALRAMSASQYREFMKSFRKLVQADNRLGLFEWTLYRVLMRNLRPQYEKTADQRPSVYGLQRMGGPCSVLLSTLAYADNRAADAAEAFARGAAKLPGVAVRLCNSAECGLKELSGALDELSQVAEKKRRPLVDACAAVICADREVTVAEVELLRGICDMLGCPMPPLLPGGPVEFAHEGAAV
jgi:Zn-dependent protease with chaperone function